jgi:hypothetical protein
MKESLADRLESVYDKAMDAKDFAAATNAALLLERAEKKSKAIVTPGGTLANVQI